jgi:hypothetical protein
METCRSFTIDREYSKSVVIAKQREGIWHEYENAEMGTEKQVEQKEEAESQEKFFIQQMYYDLDEDGYEEPYMATVHEGTGKVLRLVARFEEDNIMVKTPNGRVISLDKVLAGADNLGMNVSKDKARIEQVELVRIEPINCITDYGLIPGDLIPFEKEGSFLGIGYVHLLAALTQAINSTSNTILNSGKLKSTPGGFLAKNFRKAKGVLTYKMGQFLPTLMSPGDLQNSVREFQWPEVGEAYFAFNDKMRAEVERLAASADLTETIGANAPATTMLGLVQEQMMPVSAIILRIYRSEKKEFIKLAQLNKKYTDPAVYKDVLGEDANYTEDYGLEGLDVMPAANPEMTSRIQNMLQSMAVLDQADRILQYGGNPMPVLKRFLRDLGLDDIDEVFPPEGQDKPDPQLEALREATQLERDIAQQQNQLVAEQIKNERMRIAITKSEAIAKVKKILSEVILNLEKAETEETKNSLTLYTQQLGSLIEDIKGANQEAKEMAATEAE